MTNLESIFAKVRNWFGQGESATEAEVEARLTEFTETHATHDAFMAAVRDQAAAGVSEQVATLQNSIEAAETRANAAETENQTLAQAVGDLQATVSNLQSSITTMQTAIQTLETSIETTNGSVAAIRAGAPPARGEGDATLVIPVSTAPGGAKVISNEHTKAIADRYKAKPKA